MNLSIEIIRRPVTRNLIVKFTEAPVFKKRIQSNLKIVRVTSI